MAEEPIAREMGKAVKKMVIKIKKKLHIGHRKGNGNLTLQIRVGPEDPARRR